MLYFMIFLLACSPSLDITTARKSCTAVYGHEASTGRDPQHLSHLVQILQINELRDHLSMLFLFVCLNLNSILLCEKVEIGLHLS